MTTKSPSDTKTGKTETAAVCTWGAILSLNIIEVADLKDFRTALFRALNTWDSAPQWLHEIHDQADRIIKLKEQETSQ